MWQIKKTAENIDEAAKELPDANLVKQNHYSFSSSDKYVCGVLIVIHFFQRPEDLWANHSKVVLPKPHMKDSASWRAIQKVWYSLPNCFLYVILGLVDETSFM
jgi:hypothetical protein